MVDTLEKDGTTGALTVELRMDGARCLLTLAGALTGSSAAALEAQIDQLGCTSCGDVVVDLSALTDVDAIGTGILFGLQHYVRGRGGRLTMTGARGTVAAAVAIDPL